MIRQTGFGLSAAQTISPATLPEQQQQERSMLNLPPYNPAVSPIMALIALR